MARIGWAVVAAVLLSGTLPGAALAADPVTIRLSYVVLISNWASPLMEKKEARRPQ